MLLLRGRGGLVPNRSKGLVANMVGISFVFCVWALGAMLLRSPALPPPLTVLKYFRGVLWPTLIYHMLASLSRILLAVGLSSLLALPLGVLLGRNLFWQRWGAPMVYMLYPIPKVAFLPLIFLWLGLGDAAKIFLMGLILFFQTFVAAMDAAASIEPRLIDSLISLGASNLDIYVHGVIPSVLPRVFTALRLGTGTALAVLFFAENFATRWGIGFFILDSWMRVDYRSMYAGILALALLGVALFGAINVLERRVCKWQYAEDI